MFLRRLARAPVSRVAVELTRHVGQVDRWSAATKVGQLSLLHSWRQRPPSLADCGFRVFSQFEEDGLLLCIFALLGMGGRRFVDIGSADGINSNCANLAINHGWHGLFVDGNLELIERGRSFYAEHPDTTLWPPVFKHAFIGRENVNDVISNAGFSGEVDLLSVDIDGNDYWVWHALEAVKPRVVIIETHIEFGTSNIVVPYDPDYVYPGKHPDYHGASPVAMARMAAEKGYRLVGSNAYGFNTIYVRGNEGEDLLPTIEPEQVLGHPRNAARATRFEPLRDWPYVQGGTGFPGDPVR